MPGSNCGSGVWVRPAIPIAHMRKKKSVPPRQVRITEQWAFSSFLTLLPTFFLKSRRSEGSLRPEISLPAARNNNSRGEKTPEPRKEAAQTIVQAETLVLLRRESYFACGPESW